MNVDFKAIKIDYKFFCHQCGKVVNYLFEKTLKFRFSHKTFTWVKTVGLTCWAGLMSVGKPFLIVKICTTTRVCCC